MRIEYRKFPHTLEAGSNYHVLTYAEEGFAPLNFHARQYGLDKDLLCKFADTVNERDEIGSLAPLAPISAIPRRLVRDTKDSEELTQFIQSFLEKNASTLKAESIIFDFVTSTLPDHARLALKKSLIQHGASAEGLLILICE